MVFRSKEHLIREGAQVSTTSAAVGTVGWKGPGAPGRSGRTLELQWTFLLSVNYSAHEQMLNGELL